MYYLIGIKGSGMAPLATILHDLGYAVSGSDIDSYIFTEDALHERNIPVYSFDKKNIKDGYTVIIGNAFLEDQEEVQAARQSAQVTCYRYPEFLGHFMENYTSIAITGTHGKTTTTGMAYHMYKDFFKTSVLIGDGTGHARKDSTHFIAECCEYQDHFLAYYPTYAIISNIELDHVDYFKTLDQYIASFETFAKQVKKMVIAWGDDKNIRKLNIKNKVFYYGLQSSNDLWATNITEDDTGMTFDVYIHGSMFGHFSLPYFGRHMLYNALSIIALGYIENIDIKHIMSSLQSFKGTKRRYSIQEIGHNIFVDDYAHHPTAIEYVIKATQTRYPDKKIIAIFKPDRYSRAERFATGFASALSLADTVYYCDFPKNATKDGSTITIEDMAHLTSNAMILPENEEGANILAKHEGVVFLFMSSKDIYKLEEKVIKLKKKTI